MQEPTRRHRSLYIKVAVFECKTDEQIRNFVVDISNGSKEKWLFDLVLWATLNGKAVELCNKRDDHE
jgi:hypothetical protein